KRRAVVAHGAPDVTADYACGSAPAPVGPELAFLGEAVVDALQPLLVRTAGGLVALGQHPGAQGVAHPRQGRHVALEGNHRLALGLDEDVLDRAFQLDVQLAGGGRGLGDFRGGLLAFLAFLAFRLVAGRGRVALRADRLGHVEGVVLGAELVGDDAQRTVGLQVVGLHDLVDPLLVVVHGAHDYVVVALHGRRDHQQVDRRAVDELRCDLELGVVVVRHRGQHVGQALQAHLHRLAHARAHVQARVAAQQVHPVVDVVGLGDADVAVVPAGRRQGVGGALVLATLLVLDDEAHALVRDHVHDLPAALAQAVLFGGVLQAGADAGRRVGDADLHVRIAQRQHVPVREPVEAADRVEHDRQPAVGLDRVFDMALRRQHEADDHEQDGHDGQRNQEFNEAGHVFSRAGPGMGRGRRPAMLARLPGPAQPRGAMPNRVFRRRYTSFSSNAFSTARVRSRTPSLDRMFETWFLMVPSATPSELAISLLENPPAISRRISVSRSVSGSGWSRLTNWLRMCSSPDNSRWLIAGCTSEPPAATVWMALTSCSRDTSLSRNPLAPTFSPASTSWSSSKVVRMMVGGSWPSRASACSASSPDITGIRMSISTTSGRTFGTISTACRPSEASATTSIPSASDSSERTPCRTSVWSSTSITRTGPLMPLPLAPRRPGSPTPAFRCAGGNPPAPLFRSAGSRPPGRAARASPAGRCPPPVAPRPGRRRARPSAPCRLPAWR